MFNHEGALFPETMTIAGLYADDNFGWDRAGKTPADVDNHYIRHEWTAGLELLALLLERYAREPDPAWAARCLIPLAGRILAFFDAHFPRDERGQLRLEPAQALETWWNTINPTTDVAGLRYVLPRLLALPDELVAPALRLRWLALQSVLPAIPLGDDAGELFIQPAGSFNTLRNSENPELYAVFPFRHYAVGRDNLPIGLATFHRRLHRCSNGWGQDGIHAACLGLTDEARRDVVARFTEIPTRSRFPAFWDAHHDWIPDQDHGGTAMIALQRMLLQCDGPRILLMPAWPADWDVEFKLHAHNNTIVQGEYRAGRLESLSITPSHRRDDLERIISHD